MGRRHHLADRRGVGREEVKSLLLDTHVLLWMIEGNERLHPALRLEIEGAAEENQVYVSAITPWEIALLVSKKRLNLGEDVQEWVDRALALPGIRLYPLTPAIAVASTRLPWEMHADLADRILAATALALKATLVTADEQLLRFGAAGYLACMPAM